MARTSFVEPLESRRLLNAALGLSSAPAPAPAPILISPAHRRRVKSPASLDGRAIDATLTKFQGLPTFVGAQYRSTFSSNRFSTLGLNTSFSDDGFYTYSARHNIGVVVEQSDGITATLTLTFTSKHAGLFYANYGGGNYIEGTFVD